MPDTVLHNENKLITKREIILSWLNWLGIILCTRRLLVQFKVRAYACVAASVPGRGCSQSMRFTSLSLIFLSLPAKPIKIFLGKKIKEMTSLLL